MLSSDSDQSRVGYMYSIHGAAEMGVEAVMIRVIHQCSDAMNIRTP